MYQSSSAQALACLLSSKACKKPRCPTLFTTKQEEKTMLRHTLRRKWCWRIMWWSTNLPIPCPIVNADCSQDLLIDSHPTHSQSIHPRRCLQQRKYNIKTLRQCTHPSVLLTSPFLRLPLPLFLRLLGMECIKWNAHNRIHRWRHRRENDHISGTTISVERPYWCHPARCNAPPGKQPAARPPVERLYWWSDRPTPAKGDREVQSV